MDLFQLHTSYSYERRAYSGRFDWMTYHGVSNGGVLTEYPVPLLCLGICNAQALLARETS